METLGRCRLKRSFCRRTTATNWLRIGFGVQILWGEETSRNEVCRQGADQLRQNERRGVLRPNAGERI